MTRALVVSSLLAVLAAWATTAPAAQADPRVTANPNPIPFGDKQTVKGRGWPVIEFCSRTVRLSLRSDQNAFRIGRDRVNTRGRFRFTWIPRRRDVGVGDWTLVARMRCESGKDGSPNPVRATTPIRIGASNVVVARGRTSKGRWVLYGRHRGTFAHGRTSPDVARVEVIYGNGEAQKARLFPSPPVLSLRGGFWIAPFPGQCARVTADAFDADGMPLGRIETPRPLPVKPGQPDPQPDTDCPGSA